VTFIPTVFVREMIIWLRRQRGDMRMYVILRKYTLFCLYFYTVFMKSIIVRKLTFTPIRRNSHRGQTFIAVAPPGVQNGREQI
jgi:hypothetical protein